MSNTFWKWDGDRIVTVVVLATWFTVVAIPASVYIKAAADKQNAEVVFAKDSPELTEALMRAYQAVLDGNSSIFEEVVDIDAVIGSLNEAGYQLSKEDLYGYGDVSGKRIQGCYDVSASQGKERTFPYHPA